MARDSLWWHRDFRRLWAGDTVSQFGAFTGHTVLPLLAVTVLAASPFQMGLLTAAEYAAFLLIGLPAGVWVDRVRRRPLMVAADVARGVLMLTVPLAWWAGVLTLTQMIVVALLVGVCTVFFDVAYQSYLPFLIGRAALMEGNAKLQSSQSVAHVSAPGIAGVLVQVIGAANAVTTVGLSYLASAALLLRIRVREPEPVRVRDRRLRAEVIEGLRFVFGNRHLRAITACTASANIAGGAFTAVEVLFLTRNLGLPAAGVGVVLAIAGGGGVLGALTANWWMRRIGQARGIWLIPLVTWPAQLLIPLAAPGWRIALVPIGLAVAGYGIIVYNVAQVSYRQAVSPDHLLGRMNASIRTVVWGAVPAGGLLGGLLGEWIGIRGAVWVSAAGTVLSVLWVICSPLRSMRDLTTTKEPPAPVSAPSTR